LVYLASTTDGHVAHRQVKELSALTSLRFLAALYVVAFHYKMTFFGRDEWNGLLSLGYSGVTFFFILSGFILAYNYKDVDFSVGANLRKYAVARVARVYPLLLLSLAVSFPLFVVSLLKLSDLSMQLTAASSAVLAPIGLHAWLPGAACAWNCPSWSISAEFFFYATLPLLLPLILRRPGRWLLLVAGLWVVTSATQSAVWSTYGHGMSLFDARINADPAATFAGQYAKFFPLGRLAEFLLGIVLFTFWQTCRERRTWTPLLIFFCAAAAIIAFRETLPQVALHNGLTALAWAPLIIYGANSRDGVLNWPAMVFLGRISFAIYLLHLPLAQYISAVLTLSHLGGRDDLAWMTAIGSGLVTIAISSAVFLWIEEPARSYLTARASRSKRPERPPNPPSAACAPSRTAPATDTG
jgi:peptidoglycan/LPS O-acetylase OafA/YrhL